MSLRVGEWVRGPVSARLCAAFVVLSRTRWRGTILFKLPGTCMHKRTHTYKPGGDFSLGKSCVLIQLHPGRVSTGWHLSQFTGVYLFLCLCISKVGCIVSAHCWRLSHCWLAVYILGPRIVIETSDPLDGFESLELLAFLHPSCTGGEKRFNGF